MKFIILAFALFLAATSAFAHKVISIADGDTLTLLVEKQPLRIRLANIDAPEKRQAFGLRSKQSLAEMCVGKEAYFNVQNVDRYGRTVAVVNCGGVEVNRAQVERGLAWVDKKYNNDLSLYPIETEARKIRKGLWARKSPLPPWKFRHPTKKVAAVQAETDLTCHSGPLGRHYQIVNGHKSYSC